MKSPKTPARMKRRSVIRPWRGFAAYCPRCGRAVACDGEYVAFQTAADVREALAEGWGKGVETLAEYVADLCEQQHGCAARASGKGPVEPAGGTDA